MSNSQLTKLWRIQNEAMIVVLGSTRDTSVIAKRYLLDVPSECNSEFKTHIKVTSNANHPLHRELRLAKGGYIKRRRSWMTEAKDTIMAVCDLRLASVIHLVVQLSCESQICVHCAYELRVQGLI